MYSYQEILINSRKYPEFVTKKEFCDMCGICPHTATKILKSGNLPFRRIVNKLLHYCEISITDILVYVKNVCRLSICTDEERNKVKKYYADKFSSADDILSTPDVGKLTGYGKEAVRRWIVKGFIPAIKRRERFYVAKDDLIDFLCSSVYINIVRKSAVNLEDEINIKNILM